MSNSKYVLLVVTGGIAAYKIPELIRQLKESDITVQCILTRAGRKFVTSLTLETLSGNPVYHSLFPLRGGRTPDHIRLVRKANLVVVAPATADFLAKMANGIADDLGSTTLLANDRPILVAPAMNVKMWQHPATQSNISVLVARGVHCAGPMCGELACGEYGDGRMVEVSTLLATIKAILTVELSLGGAARPSLTGRHALVTSGPTQESIDPVRYITNRSSGKQGYAIATALAKRGAKVTLVSGPTCLPDPAGVHTIHIESAREMLDTCERALPVDILVCAAAVADWQVKDTNPYKIKKGSFLQILTLTENPDILTTLGNRKKLRPMLVIGFAAETDSVISNACRKRVAKGCDWIIANDVSREVGVFGGDLNTIHLITESGVESWPTLTKLEIAETLSDRIVTALN